MSVELLEFSNVPLLAEVPSFYRRNILIAWFFRIHLSHLNVPFQCLLCRQYAKLTFLYRHSVLTCTLDFTDLISWGHWSNLFQQGCVWSPVVKLNHFIGNHCVDQELDHQSNRPHTAPHSTACKTKPGEGVEASGVKIDDVGGITQTCLVPWLWSDVVEWVRLQSFQSVNTRLGWNK